MDDWGKVALNLCNMKSMILLILFVSTFVALPQTNPVTEFRMVGKMKYDVSKPPFLDVTIPAGSELLNARVIQFKGEIKPVFVGLAFPHAKTAGQWTTATIEHFPYDPKYFTRTYGVSYSTGLPDPRNGEIILLREPLHLRVFPLSHPTTNWTALGEMKITPARPVFDYGLPCTNNVSEVKKTEAQP
jgi:hypothetical protein